jgi:quercetin dioxygenase-like cupin family protein
MDFAVLDRAATDAKRIDEDWGSLTWLASAKLGNADELTVGRVIIKQGCNNPRHAHPTCEEVLYLLAGTLEHSAGDQVVTLHAGDTLTVGAGIFHNAVSVGDCDADMIVTYSDANRTIEHE